MKLSILDQSPVSAGKSSQDALNASINLAKHGEKLGYERFWIAEHHDLFGLACPNPSVMISAIGAQTKTIKIGAGAVLLPYYKPFHIAETYNLLATLYPGRIDLGLGRAPGGSAEVSLALSDNYLAAVHKFPEEVDQLQKFLGENHRPTTITPTPIPDVSPKLWLLGTSEKSALLAAEKELSYAFGHFMTDQDGPAIVQSYREKGKQQSTEFKEDVIIAVHIICAETRTEANELAQSYFLWKIRQNTIQKDMRVPTIKEAQQYSFSSEELADIEQMRKQMIIGNPSEVYGVLMDLDKQYQADEYMIVTIVHDENAKLKSYELIKEKVCSQL